MSSSIQIEIRGNQFILLPEKAVYWIEEDALLFADLHAGKANHFRKHGIPISSDPLLQDLNTIDLLIQQTNAKKVIILGDLFHSYHNTENEFVVRWINEQKIPFTLIKGNHDLHTPVYDGLIEVDEWTQGSLRLVHDPLEKESEYFQIGGHIHPGFRIRGKARQSMRFPCFFISQQHMILPAFGSLTGSVNMKPQKNDTLVLVTPEGLVAL